MRKKRANAILAAVVVVAVSAAGILILSALNTTQDFKDDIKDNIRGKYDRETFVTLILDDAVDKMLQAEAHTSGITTYGECEELLDGLKAEYAPSGIFEQVDADYLPDDADLPREYHKHLQESLGKNHNAIADCFLDDDIYISYDMEDEPLTGFDIVPLEPFSITVLLTTRQYNCQRTWQITGAYLEVEDEGGGFIGKLSFSDAEFTILESNI